MKVNQYQKNTVSVEFNQAFTDKHEVCEVSEWSNGEGFDIVFEHAEGGYSHMSLSYEEVHALVAALNLIALKD